MQISNKSLISGSRKSRQAVGQQNFGNVFVINLACVCVYGKCQMVKANWQLLMPNVDSVMCVFVFCVCGCVCVCVSLGVCSFHYHLSWAVALGVRCLRCFVCFHCSAPWSMLRFFLISSDSLIFGIIQQLATIQGATLIRISQVLFNEPATKLFQIKARLTKINSLLNARIERVREREEERNR